MKGLEIKINGFIGMASEESYDLGDILSIYNSDFDISL